MNYIASPQTNLKVSFPISCYIVQFAFRFAHISLENVSDDLNPRRIDFQNILSTVSSDRHTLVTLSFDSQKKIEAGENTKVTDSSEEDVVEPLCTSMKKLNSMTEQNYEQQMKTPSDFTASKKVVSEQLARGLSFRKSLVFDSGLTPHDDSSNSMTNHKSNENEMGERPKAKTSLIFCEPTISVKSFYGSSVEKPIEIKRSFDIDAILRNRELAAAISKQKTKSNKLTKPKTQSKSLAKRMKAPSLWRLSGKIKFNRHKRRSLKENKTKQHGTLRSSTKVGQKEQIDDNSENVPPVGAEFTSTIEQNLRLQKILKDQTNVLAKSRDINWNGALNATNESAANQSSFFNSDDEDESDNERRLAENLNTYEEVEVEVEEPANRKFFKSRAGTAAKKYRVMGRLSATLKRGGDLKFDIPKRKKRKPNKGEN